MPTRPQIIDAMAVSLMAAEREHRASRRRVDRQQRLAATA